MKRLLAAAALVAVKLDAGHISSALQTELGITYQEHELRFAARVLRQPLP